MEKVDDVQLIHKILTGDAAAFNKLVKKHQKNVHALAWRKIGDFHIAEEITQDTFLTVYHKLSTLKDPHRFVGWLYSIAARQCVLFQRKKRIPTQFLEDTDIKFIEKMTYSQYIAEEQAKTAIEKQRTRVQKLLSHLPKSQRTVVTLHYLQEMTCKEIGLLLGTSENTIKSRLHRARQQLKQSTPIAPLDTQLHKKHGSLR